MKMKWTALATALFMVGCGVVADKPVTDGLTKADKSKAAKDDRGHPPRPMTASRLQQLQKEYDADNNGIVTWAEYNDWRRARFDKTDANNNGVVDAEEYVYEYEERLDNQLASERKKQAELSAMRFASLDSDEDGVIQWAEYQQQGDTLFNSRDCDASGVVDAADKNCQKKADKKMKRRSWLRMPSGHNYKGFMALYDASQSDAVSRADFNRERRSVFHLMDTDNDGRVSAKEFAAQYERKVDAAIDRTRRGAIHQTYIRFGVLDDNKDKAMTFDELQLSGKRIFYRWDKNQDGVISAKDITTPKTGGAKYPKAGS